MSQRISLTGNPITQKSQKIESKSVQAGLMTLNTSLLFWVTGVALQYYRELKQRERQRPRKRHPKSEFALIHTSSKKRISSPYVQVLHKTWTGLALPGRSRTCITVTAEKCTEERHTRSELLFCKILPIAFCRSRCRWRRRCLSSLFSLPWLILSFRDLAWD